MLSRFGISLVPRPYQKQPGNFCELHPGTAVNIHVACISYVLPAAENSTILIMEANRSQANISHGVECLCYTSAIERSTKHAVAVE